MLRLILLLFSCFLLPSGISACSCTGDAEISAQSEIVIHSGTQDGQPPSKQNACLQNCSMTITAPENKGIKVMVTTCLINAGLVKFFDGDSDEAFTTLDESTCTPGLFVGPTTGRVLRVTIEDYAKDDSEALQFNGFAVPIEPASTTTTAPTTTTVTVPPYAGDTPFVHDPHLYQIELAVAIDTSAKSESNTYNKMKEFGVSLVNRLYVHNDINNPSGARVSLIFLTPRGNENPLPWMDDAMSFNRTLLGYPQYKTGPPICQQTLKNFAEQRFKIGSEVMSSRTYAPRVLLILTSNDCADKDEVKTVLEAYDVIPIIMNFGTLELPYLEAMLAGTDGSSILKQTYNEQNDLDTNVDRLLNETLLLGAKLCQDTTGVILKDLKDGEVSIQSSRFDATMTNMHTKNNGQKGRYCNLQDTSFEVPNTDSSKKYISLQIEYELEPEADYVRVKDENGEVQALFTGFDVRESQICFESNKATIEFHTDAKQVYGGYYMKLSAVENCEN